MQNIINMRLLNETDNKVFLKLYGPGSPEGLYETIELMEKEESKKLEGKIVIIYEGLNSFIRHEDFYMMNDREKTFNIYRIGNTLEVL